MLYARHRVRSDTETFLGFTYACGITVHTTYIIKTTPEVLILSTLSFLSKATVTDIAFIGCWMHSQSYSSHFIHNIQYISLSPNILDYSVWDSSVTNK